MAFGVNSTNQTYSVSPAYRTFQINGADPRFEGYLRVFNGRLSKRFLITSARQGKAIDFEGLFNTECYFLPERNNSKLLAPFSSCAKSLTIYASCEKPSSAKNAA